MSGLAWLGVALLGGAGAIARFRLEAAVQRLARTDFPVGTFTVNVGGSFCLGLLTGLGIGDTLLFVLGTGFIGSFTTFSTWMLETERLGEEGDGRLALANVGLSLAAGLAAGALGWGIGAVV